MLGTLTILHTLINTESTPPGIRVYRKRQLQRAIQRPFELPSPDVSHAELSDSVDLHAQDVFLGGLFLVILMGCLLAPGIKTLMVLFSVAAVIRVGYSAGLLLFIGIGSAVLADGIRRQIARAQRSHAWDLMLILPYARHEIVLGWAAQGFAPFLVQIGFMLVLLIGMMLTVNPLAPLPLLALSILLTVEWLQLIALSVTVGLLSAGGRQSGVNIVAPIAYGLLLATGRAVGGALVATAAGWHEFRFSAALVVGPLSGVAAGAWGIALLLGLLDLLALELLIRALFAWGMSRLGES